MSATNRGGERIASDNYPTPSYAVRRLLELPLVQRLVGAPNLVCLDPCAGEGSIIRAARPMLDPATKFVGVEIRPECAPSLGRSCTATIGDYLAMPPIRADLIITNPPFSRAQKFIEKSIAECPLSFYLLRLNFLGAAKRHEFWKAHMPWAVFVLPNRPSFDPAKPGGTDATEYAWFAFTDKKNVCSELHVLGLTSREERSIG